MQCSHYLRAIACTGLDRSIAANNCSHDQSSFPLGFPIARLLFLIIARRRHRQEKHGSRSSSFRVHLFRPARACPMRGSALNIKVKVAKPSLVIHAWVTSKYPPLSLSLSLPPSLPFPPSIRGARGLAAAARRLRSKGRARALCNRDFDIRPYGARLGQRKHGRGVNIHAWVTLSSVESAIWSTRTLHVFNESSAETTTANRFFLLSTMFPLLAEYANE